MAKVKNEVAKIDSNTPPKIDDVKFRPQRDSDRLQVKTVRGKEMLWTLEQCLLPQNWKQMTASSQNIIINGSSVSKEIEKQS